MNDKLVSVVVVTYNSAKYVRETLDSIYEQDYRNIQLIISDDCSKDNTRDICQEWLNTHADKFTIAQLVKTPRNRGICGNYNYALTFVKGEWIKYIAGDDILYPNCISELVRISSQGECKLYYGAVTPFSTVNGKYVEKETRSVGKYCFSIDNPREQLNRLIEKIWYVSEGPSIFLNTLVFKQMGGGK